MMFCQYARKLDFAPKNTTASRWFSMLALFLLSGTALAAEGLYFLDLKVSPKGEKMEIRSEPVLLATYEQIQNPEYSFPMYFEHRFDAPLQQLRDLLIELDAKRDQFERELRKKPMHVVTLTYSLNMRRNSGSLIQRDNYDVEVQLLPTPGMVRLESDDDAVDIKIAETTSNEGYIRFLKQIIFPNAYARLKKPNSSEFFVDLYFTCTEMRDGLRQLKDLESKAGVTAMATLLTYNSQKHLGTTYCTNQRGKWEFVESGHLYFYRDSLQEYATALAKRDRGKPYLADLENYLSKSPSDFKAVKLLLKGYMEENKTDKAFDLVSQYKPLFEESEDIMSIFRELLAKNEAKRLKLLNQRDAFRRDENVKINITSPKVNDFVGGKAKVTFDMTGHKSPILQIDCLADRQVVGSITGPPYEIPFTVPLEKVRIRLKVAAYFENGTFQETEIPVKTLYIGVQEQVHLVTLRMVASRYNQGFLTNLGLGDLKLLEGNEERQITKFQKDQKPLRVAILIDTSSSMIGDKLYRAQDAVNTFLSKLEPTDRASIYTFDHSVLRLSDFTNRHKQIQPVLLTLSPRHSTSLYNALTIAHQDLQKEQGTQVIIVISDGRDSGSLVNDDKIYNMLKASRSLVYSVVINTHTYNKEGIAFMRRISEITGSNFMEVEEGARLSKSFDTIYRELKSSYLIDFYSKQQDFSRDKLRIRFRQNGIRARFNRQ